MLKASSTSFATQLEASRMQQSAISQTLLSMEARLSSVALTPESLLEQLKAVIDPMKQASDSMKIITVLQNLQFPTMNDRFRSVIDSAPKTFSWIFDDPERLLREEKALNISFTDWLRSGSGIFHIVGKPGAGKSTLMTFICEHRKTKALLRQWAGSRDMITVNFFFWKIGSVDQKSLSGLVRGLLFAVIQQEPDLARLLFPRAWEDDPRSSSLSFVCYSDKPGGIRCLLRDGPGPASFEQALHVLLR
jgi:hypothetical protein